MDRRISKTTCFGKTSWTAKLNKRSLGFIKSFMKIAVGGIVLDAKKLVIN
jgi:hypothetical protein